MHSPSYTLELSSIDGLIHYILENILSNYTASFNAFYKQIGPRNAGAMYKNLHVLN
jgi:hypothetical protein